MSTPSAAQQPSNLDGVPHESPMADTSKEQQDAETSEIKQMADQYGHLDLNALAPMTRTEENGTRADRFRSLFGYQWLKKACGKRTLPLFPRKWS